MQRYGGLNLMPQVGYQQQTPAAQTNYTQQRTQRSSNNTKALVGFGHVPKFVPPTYDNVDPNQLPCPETPSPRGSLCSSEDDYANNNNFQQTRAQPAATRAGGNGKPFPPGSFVEYRSRTMQDRWILAKVEAFDDRNQVYKLDVQPKAPMDRVRLRQSNAKSESRPQESSQPQPNRLHEVVDPFAEAGVDELKQENAQLKQKVADLERQLAAEKAEKQQLEQQLRGMMQ